MGSGNAMLSVLACLAAGCSALALGSDAGSAGSGSGNDVTIDVTMHVGVCELCQSGQSCPCVPQYYCPTVNPDPASVKAGQGVRWSWTNGDDVADAGAGVGAYTVTVLEGTKPWTTVAPGQVSGSIVFSDAYTHTYTFSSSIPLGCEAQTRLGSPQLPPYTLYVTTN